MDRLPPLVFQVCAAQSADLSCQAEGNLSPMALLVASTGVSSCCPCYAHLGCNSLAVLPGCLPQAAGLRSLGYCNLPPKLLDAPSFGVDGSFAA